jgi:pentatricopeptide repeat protein
MPRSLLDEEEPGANKLAVIGQYEKVIGKENREDGPDEWCDSCKLGAAGVNAAACCFRGFKAYSRIVCLHCEHGDFDKMIEAYKTMIGDDYCSGNRVTARLKQEEIERVLNVAGTTGMSSTSSDDVLLQVFETTLAMFDSQTVRGSTYIEH